MKSTAIIFAALVAASQAAAEDSRYVYFGLGIEDFQVHHSMAPGALVEYSSKPFSLWDWPSGFRLRVAMMVSTDRDFWVGTGLSYEFPMAEGSRWFGELSFVPGVFRRGNARPGDELIHFPQFRSQVALGYRFENDRTLTFTASHRSNAKLDASGSSTETLMLRYGIPF